MTSATAPAPVSVVLAATPSPGETSTSTGTSTAGTTPEVDADLVTPGLWGFLLLFVLAVGVYFLGRSMARRIQRVNHRAQLEAEEAAARAEAIGTAAAHPANPSHPADPASPEGKTPPQD